MPAAAETEYLVLEDITAGFTHPCIMDMKMGTRQHGADASADKKRKQMAKCRATTSAELGLRICGQQVYQPASSDYVCRDKYFGRQVTVNGFPAALAAYFVDGAADRTLFVAPLVARLQAILGELERCERVRLYSSSLLFVYEGDPSVTDASRCDVRLIDFAHSTMDATADDDDCADGPDQGYLMGLRNLIRFLGAIVG